MTRTDIRDLQRMEAEALPVGESAQDKMNKRRMQMLAESVEYTRVRAEKTARRLIRARARQGDFAIPPGATAEDLMDLVDDLAKRTHELHITVKQRDLDCLRTWNNTRRFQLQVRKEPDGVGEPDKAVGLVLA